MVPGYTQAARITDDNNAFHAIAHMTEVEETRKYTNMHVYGKQLRAPHNRERDLKDTIRNKKTAFLGMFSLFFLG
jgi:hypothetical protein